MKLTVSSFPFFATVYNNFVFVDSNSRVSATIQNYTHVHTKLLLTVTDTVNSQNTEFSS